MFDPDDVQSDVTRYLLTAQSGRLFPMGVDRFESEALAKARCREDFGIEAHDWREITEEPEFHAPVVDATENAIQNYRTAL
jgi:hypothetical protein